MGLDWNPLARPLPGMEHEFDRLLAELDPDRARARRGLAGRLLASLWQTESRQRARIQRFRDISEPPFATLGAPRVGYDAAADAWLRQKLDANGKAAELERARREMHGYCVLDLLPPCDGFPRYTNYGAYEGVDRYSFRAAFLDDVKEILGKDLHEKAWRRMTARELETYAAAIEAATRPWAERAGVAHVEHAQEAPPYREDDPASRADVLFSAVRWCRFWASRGHGLEPWY